MKVSVITPVYNVGKYLRQCLESLKEQTLNDIEFICVNDGSTDNSSEILNEYAQQDKRFLIINQRNGGYGKAMNAGLKVAKGKYVGILESDDFAAPDMFSKLYEKAVQYDSDVVRCNFYNYSEEKTTKVEFVPSDICNKIICPRKEAKSFFGSIIAIWAGLYRKDFLIKNNILFNETPGASYQDVSFFIKTMGCVDKAIFLDDALLYYRTDNVLSSVHSKEKVDCIFDEFKEAKKFFKGDNDMLQIITLMEAGHYWAHYTGRIGNEYKNYFLKKAIYELDTDKVLKHEIIDNIKSNEVRRFWQDAMNNKNLFIFSEHIRWQKLQIIHDGFLHILHAFPHFYIYGAGKVAKSIMHILCREGLKPSGIIVSNTCNNPSSICNVPVDSLANSKVDKEHDAIIISVTPRKPDIQQEIFKLLDDTGYKNIIVLTKELQEALGV